MSTRESVRFEPQTSVMVLDTAFRLYFQNFTLMLGIAALAMIPQFIFSVLLLLPMALWPETPLVLGIAGLVGILIALVSYIVVFPLATGAATKAVSERYLGNEVTVGSAFGTAWKRFGNLFVTQFVVSLIVGLGTLLLIVPGILWALSYAVAVPVAVVESLSPSENRKRSWELVKGERWRVAKIFAILLVINGILGAIGGSIATTGLDAQSPFAPLLNQVGANLMAILVYPLQAIAVTLLYYDLRIRKEGFDLEMLSRSLGSPSKA